MYKCEYCGVEFDAEKKRRFCTPRCSANSVRNKRPPQNCVICGAEFRPFHKNQVTCGNIKCTEENSRRIKYAKHKKYIELNPKPKKPKKPTAAEWGNLTPCERWVHMTLTEIDAECLRYHMSYGQAQTMKQRGELPEDFGLGCKHEG